KGGGAGGGAGVDPVALIVILKGVPGPEGIKVLSLAAPNPIAKAISDITPAIMDKLKEKKEAPKEKR
ncbi:MAG: spore germination protein GerW family protein, partial [Nitrososphaerales archaeon]